MHRLEAVGPTEAVAVGELDKQVSGGRRVDRQQWMGNHGDPALLVDGADRLREGQPGRHSGREAHPQQVPLTGGDLLADHKLDRDSLVARTSEQLLGHINAVVVGEDGDLQVTGTERGIDRHRRPCVGRVAAGMNMEIGATKDGMPSICEIITGEDV